MADLIQNNLKVAVVIPAYKVRAHVLGVISQIGSEVDKIYVVDDACPEDSGIFVQSNCTDPRVTVLIHSSNKGVGGAVMTGYAAAIEEGYDIIVKVDGDGQMLPSLIPQFIAPIATGEVDYTKGNRFYDLEALRAMPKVRLFGNAALSFLTKLSSGYWDLFDPTNGYTAIHRDVARHLPFKKISQRYFFETDILFRLNVLRAVVADIPMEARYEEEVSNLRISKVLFEFLGKHIRNFGKRIFYNYYLRDMSLASIELPLGCIALVTGGLLGGSHWLSAISTGIPTPTGTVVLSALGIILGVQFLLAFLAYDIAFVPRNPIHSRLNAQKGTLTCR